MTWPSADLHSRLQRDARLRLHGALLAMPPAVLLVAGVTGWIRAVDPDTTPLAVVFGVIGVVVGLWGPVLRPWRLRQARENDQVVAPPVPVHVAVVHPAPRSWLDGLVAVWDQDPTQHPPCGVYAADLSAQDLTGLGPVAATVVGGPTDWPSTAPSTTSHRSSRRDGPTSCSGCTRGAEPVACGRTRTGRGAGPG